MSTQSGESGDNQFQAGQNTRPGAKKLLQMLAITAIAVTGISILILVIARTDYIEYWSSGKLLIHHTDPYSPADVLALEQTYGVTKSTFIVMLNPPWALFLVAPLGFVGIRTGLFLWTLAITCCVAGSVRLLSISSKERALAFVFAPAIAAILMGQSSPFLLLGFSLFLRFHRSRPFLAGASLLFMAIKPHLFLIFWTLLLVDCIRRRRYLILAGGLSALAAGTAFSMCFDPRVWPHYLAMLRGYKLQQGFLPTASMLFRMLIDVHAFWLLFVPSAFAILWGLWYYFRRRQVWDWRVHGMLLMLVTVLASPYGFFTDEVVLLPSILFALSLPQKRKYSEWGLLTINTVALLIVLVKHAALSSHAYMWTPAAWLAWFLYATTGFRRADSSRGLPSNLAAPAVIQSQ